MSRTYFFWDPLSDNILQERDESGTVTAEYTTEPGLYGNVISQNRGGIESQYHFDPQGSTLALTDDNQQITDTYAYSAFGEVTEHSGSTVNPFQYIGQKGYYRDDETEAYEVTSDVLSISDGRWLNPSVLTTYVYEKNRPLSSGGRSSQYPNNFISASRLNYDDLWQEWQDYSLGIRGASRAATGPKCEVTFVCWPAFQIIVPKVLGQYHCEYRFKLSTWPDYRKCRCTFGLCEDLPSYKKCCTPAYIPIRGYKIPIPEIPGCLGCTSAGLSSKKQDYQPGAIESVKTFPASVCTCLASACDAFPRTLCYTALGPNSNTGAFCLAQKCGVQMSLPKGLKLDGVPGWDDSCPATFVTLPSPTPIFEAP